MPTLRGLIADGLFDLVFIDADHSYEAVRNDIAAWRCKVRPGGILCGHDCESRISSELQDSILVNKHLDTISGEGTPFEKIHPGSILAVDEVFQGAASLFAESPVTLADGRTGRSTIWFVTI